MREGKTLLVPIGPWPVRHLTRIPEREKSNATCTPFAHRGSRWGLVELEGFRISPYRSNVGVACTHCAVRWLINARYGPKHGMNPIYAQADSVPRYRGPVGIFFAAFIDPPLSCSQGRSAGPPPAHPLKCSLAGGWLWGGRNDDTVVLTR